MFYSHEQAESLEGEIVRLSRPAFQSRLHGGLPDEGCEFSFSLTIKSSGTVA